MSEQLVKQQRENRQNGMDNNENGLELALEGYDLQNPVERRAVCLSMMGDGTQAEPSSHERIFQRDFCHFDLIALDELPSDDGNPELALMKKDGSLLNGDEDLQPDE